MAQWEIIAILKQHKGKKFGVKDICALMPYNVNPASINESLIKLRKFHMVKFEERHTGAGPKFVYWR